MPFSSHRIARLVAIGAALGCAPHVFATFEDIYGPSGASFQGAVGLRVAEATSATGAAQTSFGAAIDDMVVQWREYKLIDDATNCATSGACASVSADTTSFYESNGSLGITVVDASPYGQLVPVNDCNQDGDFVDAGVDDQDCNDNGTTDVTVRAVSLAEPAGELVILDRIGATTLYRGTLAISTAVQAAGVLLFGNAGSANSEVTISYKDRWDGSASGTECRASSDPVDWGTVTLELEIPIAAGRVTVVRYRVSDAPGTGTPALPAGQDGDGFPDTNETVDLFLTVRNQTSAALTNFVAQIASSDPKIDCILLSSAYVANVPAHAIVELPVSMRFKVAAGADRAGLVPPVACASGACSNGAGACVVANDCKKTTLDTYAASFTVLLASDQFDASAVPQALSVEIDLNASTAVKATATFTEGFEAGLLNMFSMTLDDGIANNTLSNGRRCQYNDPDFVGSNSFGDSECYLGFVVGQTNPNDWHLHDSADSDGGRAYLGVRSMHYGIHDFGNPGLDTYGLSQMDAIRTKNGINLAARICRDDPAPDKRACNAAADCVGFGGGPCVSANPELSFKQQISTTDSRSTGTPAGQAADRGVVQVLLGTNPVWQKIAPYQNEYDVRGTNNFSNCIFDPIDDGNTEDSYFDPTDPDRRFGPSSTCFPEFVFSYIGDTDAPFSVSNIGRASEGPGLQGSLGLGTWVESKFDLSRFRGRQIRVRWLFTSIKVSDITTLESLFHWNPNPGDDGWYVDDVRVTQTLGTSLSTVTQDTIDHSALPGCGVVCSSVDAALTATPPSTPTPGTAIRLSSVGSLADRCVGGTLLSEFWIDGNANDSLGDPADVLLSPGAVDPFFDEAPLVTTRYAVRVRCSSAPACSDTAFVTVPVHCPGTPGVFNPEAWWNRLKFTSKTTLVAPPAGQSIDAARGDLAALRSSGSFGGEVCLADGVPFATFTDASVPALGSGYYYLLRGTDSACNENRSWRTFSPKENPTDPARRDNQIGVCTP